VPYAQVAAQCAALHPSAQPASVHNDKSNDLLFSLTDKYGPWLGLSRTDSSSSWTWADGSVVDYTNWYTGQPRDGENCAYLKEQGLGLGPEWASADCTTSWPYCCQLETS